MAASGATVSTWPVAVAAAQEGFRQLTGDDDTATAAVDELFTTASGSESSAA